jgi:hypothetical protein
MAARQSSVSLPGGLPVTLLATAAALMLSACGSGGDTTSTASTANASTAAVLAEVTATPTFHLAPAELSEPLSAPAAAQNLAEVHSETLLSGMQDVATAGLLPDTIRQYTEVRRTVLRQMAEQGVTADAGSATTAVKTYTPAQIRAAYNLPAVTGTAIPAGAAARAALGAGQTIYLIDANHNPSALSDLNTFSSHFGLPGCSNETVAPASTLPLAPAMATAGCTFSVVYAGSGGKMSATAPAYDSGWATEISLDVQSSHAMAPLARIVLIEAPSSSLSALESAITLANNMGSGIVSMSFGSAEGSYMASIDELFQVAGMQYFASTGDSGAAVNWPAASAHVVAVGGTTLTYNGGARSEVAWTDTGGGTSQYVAVPTYQAALPKASNHRRVADVSFDADPYTGQYVAFTPKGGALGWFSAGGTSIAAPEWAAIAAVTNAERLAGGYVMLKSFHNAIYLNAHATTAIASASFLDVSAGADGRCATCTSTTGYDTPTGLGTPNATALINVLGTVNQ